MQTKIVESYKIYEDHGIVHLVIHEGSCLEYNEAIEIDLYLKNSLGNKRYLQLFDARSDFSLTDKARAFFGSPKLKRKTIALAVLIGSNTQQKIINLFAEMNTRKLPVKIFVNYDEGISWLRSFEGKK